MHGGFYYIIEKAFPHIIEANAILSYTSRILSDDQRNNDDDSYDDNDILQRMNDNKSSHNIKALPNGM